MERISKLPGLHLGGRKELVLGGSQRSGPVASGGTQVVTGFKIPTEELIVRGARHTWAQEQ